MARLLTPFVFLAFKWDHHRASWPLVGKSWIYTEDRGEIKDRLDAKLSRNLTQIYNTNDWLQYYPEYSIIRNNVNPYQSNNGNEIWSDNKSTMDPYNAWIEIRAATKLAKVSTKKAKKKKDEKLFNKIPSRNLRVRPKRYSIYLIKSVVRAVFHSIENEFLVEEFSYYSFVQRNLSGACGWERIMDIIKIRRA